MTTETLPPTTDEPEDDTLEDDTEPVKTDVPGEDE